MQISSFFLPVMPSGPGLLFVGSFLFVLIFKDCISLLVIGLFKLAPLSCFDGLFLESCPFLVGCHC